MQGINACLKEYYVSCIRIVEFSKSQQQRKQSKRPYLVFEHASSIRLLLKTTLPLPQIMNLHSLICSKYCHFYCQFMTINPHSPPQIILLPVTACNLFSKTKLKVNELRSLTLIVLTFFTGSWSHVPLIPFIIFQC